MPQKSHKKHAPGKDQMRIVLEHNTRGYESRGLCSICKRKKSIEVIDNEQDIWLECKNNGQAAAWEIAREMGERTTSRLWPNIDSGQTSLQDWYEPSRMTIASTLRDYIS